MEKMKELYAKVAADSTLQAKFTEIMKNAESAGKEATEAKLIDFAKEAGFEISLEDIIAFFSEKSEASADVLNDAELDMVAGGKSQGGNMLNFAYSVATVAIGCGLMSGLATVANDSCGDMWESLAKS